MNKPDYAAKMEIRTYTKEMAQAMMELEKKKTEFHHLGLKLSSLEDQKEYNSDKYIILVRELEIAEKEVLKLENKIEGCQKIIEEAIDILVPTKDFIIIINAWMQEEGQLENFYRIITAASLEHAISKFKFSEQGKIMIDDLIQEGYDVKVNSVELIRIQK